MGNGEQIENRDRTPKSHLAPVEKAGNLQKEGWAAVGHGAIHGHESAQEAQTRVKESDKLPVRPEHQQEQERLSKNLDRLPADQKGRIEKDMKDFERREPSMEEQYRRQLHSQHPEYKPEQLQKMAHVKAEHELSETYKHVNELLERTSSVTGMTMKMQRDVAEGIMHNAAHYELIDQGDHNTCNMTVLEKRAYARSPSEAARLASEVALTGQYETTRSHIKVKIDPQSIVPKPGQEEFGEPPVRDDQRSLASRIYQVTAPNVYFRLNKMNVEYVQTSKLANDPDDTGERIRSNTTGKFLNDFEGKQIRRPGGGDFDATGKAAVMAIDAEITCPSNEKPQTNWFVPSYEYVGENNSPADLSKRLKDALDNGEGPLVLDVRGQNAPFWKVNRGHVVTIDSYRPGQFPGELPTFFMDNQWGEAKDHHYESVYVLARARGHGDPRAHSDQELTNGEGGKEFAQDLLQLKDLYEKYRSQNMSPAEFKHAVLDQLDAIFLQMHQFARPIDGHLPGIDRFDQHGYSLLGRQMATILSHLPKAERQAVIKHMKDLGVLNNYIE